jgi:hypothetical protein
VFTTDPPIERQRCCRRYEPTNKQTNKQTPRPRGLNRPGLGGDLSMTAQRTRASRLSRPQPGRGDQGRRRGRSEPGGWRAQAVPPQAFSRASAQSRACHLPPPISNRHGQATALGPSWGRRTAVAHGQPRCPADNQTRSSSAVIGRGGAAGPYMACKGSGVQIPSAPPQVNRPIRPRPSRNRRPQAADGQQLCSALGAIGSSRAAAPRASLPWRPLSRRGAGRGPSSVTTCLWQASVDRGAAVVDATTDPRGGVAKLCYEYALRLPRCM